MAAAGVFALRLHYPEAAGTVVVLAAQALTFALLYAAIWLGLPGGLAAARDLTRLLGAVSARPATPVAKNDASDARLE